MDKPTQHDSMGNGEYVEFPLLYDPVENYLLLIDDHLKSLIGGVLHVCVNDRHDCWMPVDLVGQIALKHLAQTCVLRRREQLERRVRSLDE